MDIQEHIKKVSQWLDENVRIFPTPGTVTLSAFEIESGDYSGSFEVCLDGLRIDRRFRFDLGGNGKPALYFPMFTSPLGAPASYAAVELTDETKMAIKELLASILPRMKPLGLNRETGEKVYRTTHTVTDRILCKDEYAAIFERISERDFSISRPV